LSDDEFYYFFAKKIDKGVETSFKGYYILIRLKFNLGK